MDASSSAYAVKIDKMEEKRSNNGILFLTKDYISNDCNLTIVKKLMKNEISYLHWHDFFEFEFVVSGKYRQVINGVSYESEEGMFCLLSPTDYHEICFDEEVCLITLMFDENILPDYYLNILYEASGKLVFKPDRRLFSKLRGILETMLCQGNMSKEDRVFYITNLLCCVISDIKPLLAKNEPIQKNELDLSDNFGLHKALCYIRVHFRENPSLEEAAAVAHYTKTYFCRAFKDYFGKTYVEYLTEQKLIYAKKLLMTTKQKVTDICYRSGFESISNFYKYFYNYFGSAPQKYRVEQSDEKSDNN